MDNSSANNPEVVDYYLKTEDVYVVVRDDNNVKLNVVPIEKPSETNEDELLIKQPLKVKKKAKKKRFRNLYCASNEDDEESDVFEAHKEENPLVNDSVPLSDSNTSLNTSKSRIKVLENILINVSSSMNGDESSVFEDDNEHFLSNDSLNSITSKISTLSGLDVSAEKNSIEDEIEDDNENVLLIPTELLGEGIIVNGEDGSFFLDPEIALSLEKQSESEVLSCDDTLEEIIPDLESDIGNEEIIADSEDNEDSSPIPLTCAPIENSDLFIEQEVFNSSGNAIENYNFIPAVTGDCSIESYEPSDADLDEVALNNKTMEKLSRSEVTKIVLGEGFDARLIDDENAMDLLQLPEELKEQYSNVTLDIPVVPLKVPKKTGRKKRQILPKRIKHTLKSKKNKCSGNVKSAVKRKYRKKKKIEPKVSTMKTVKRPYRRKQEIDPKISELQLTIALNAVRTDELAKRYANKTRTTATFDKSENSGGNSANVSKMNKKIECAFKLDTKEESCDNGKSLKVSIDLSKSPELLRQLNNGIKRQRKRLFLLDKKQKTPEKSIQRENKETSIIDETPDSYNGIVSNNSSKIVRKYTNKRLKYKKETTDSSDQLNATESNVNDNSQSETKKTTEDSSEKKQNKGLPLVKRRMKMKRKYFGRHGHSIVSISPVCKQVLKKDQAVEEKVRTDKEQKSINSADIDLKTSPMDNECSVIQAFGKKSLRSQVVKNITKEPSSKVQEPVVTDQEQDCSINSANILDSKSSPMDNKCSGIQQLKKSLRSQSPMNGEIVADDKNCSINENQSHPQPLMNSLNVDGTISEESDSTDKVKISNDTSIDTVPITVPDLPESSETCAEDKETTSKNLKGNKHKKESFILPPKQHFDQNQLNNANTSLVLGPSNIESSPEHIENSKITELKEIGLENKSIAQPKANKSSFRSLRSQKINENDEINNKNYDKETNTRQKQEITSESLDVKHTNEKIKVVESPEIEKKRKLRSSIAPANNTLSNRFGKSSRRNSFQDEYVRHLNQKATSSSTDVPRTKNNTLKENVVHNSTKSKDFTEKSLRLRSTFKHTFKINKNIKEKSKRKETTGRLLRQRKTNVEIIEEVECQKKSNKVTEHIVDIDNIGSSIGEINLQIVDEPLVDNSGPGLLGNNPAPNTESDKEKIEIATTTTLKTHSDESLESSQENPPIITNEIKKENLPNIAKMIQEEERPIESEMITNIISHQTSMESPSMVIEVTTAGENSIIIEKTTADSEAVHSENDSKKTPKRLNESLPETDTKKKKYHKKNGKISEFTESTQINAENTSIKIPLELEKSPPSKENLMNNINNQILNSESPKNKPKAGKSPKIISPLKNFKLSNTPFKISLKNLIAKPKTPKRSIKDDKPLENSETLENAKINAEPIKDSSLLSENDDEEKISKSQIDKNEGALGFHVGDLVYARYFKFPYWPCMVIKDPTIGRHYKQVKEDFVYHVRFFADNGRTGWIPNQDLIVYKGPNTLKEHLEYYLEKEKTAKRKLSNFESKQKKACLIKTSNITWKKAVTEAESLTEKTVEERHLFFTKLFEEKHAEDEKKRVAKALSKKPSAKPLSLDKKRKRLSSENTIASSSKPIENIKRTEYPLSPLKRRKLIIPSDVSTLIPKPNFVEEDLLSISQIKQETLDDTSEDIESQDVKIIETSQQPKLSKQRRMSLRSRQLIHVDLISEHSDSEASSKTSKPDLTVHNKRILFKDVARIPVCEVCLKNDDLVLKCKGKCCGFYHAKCSQVKEEPTENANVQIIDVKSKKKHFDRTKITLNCADDLPDIPLLDKINNKLECVMETVSTRTIYKDSTTDQSSEDTDLESKGTKPIEDDFVCANCKQDVIPVCNACNSSFYYDQKTDRFKCSINGCGKYYHKLCLKYWPQARTIDFTNENFICPMHYCHTCISENPQNYCATTPIPKLVRCLKCPASYHVDSFCVPAGTQILSQTQVICPRHVQHKVKRYTVNANWCFICSRGGNLLCCETCPTSVHLDCMDINLRPDDTFVCEDCESGRLPLYDEIVWAKFGRYRWWPALILYPIDVSDKILKLPHKTGEFVVKFFGTHDHSWIGIGKVFLFVEGDTEEKDEENNKVFMRALNEAKEMITLKQEIRRNRELVNQKSEKPPPYIRIKVNRPIGNIKLFDGNISNTNPCNCTIDSENPCGPDSNCLNRLLMIECDPEICPAKALCQNQRFEKRQYATIVPFKTKERGWGLISTELISKGDFVTEYVGEVIDQEEYQRRIRVIQEQKRDNFYFLTIDATRIIDAGPKGNLARFMNHCCKPNCETQKWTVRGDTRVGLFAIEDIPACTELTFNYNLQSTGDKKKICKCGADICSGFIGEKTTKEIAKPKVTTTKQKTGKINGETLCFVCKMPNCNIKCSVFSCRKFYHKKCVRFKGSREVIGAWTCPRHRCKTCRNRSSPFCDECMESYCKVHSVGKLVQSSSGFLCNSHHS